MTKSLLFLSVFAVISFAQATQFDYYSVTLNTAYNVGQCREQVRAMGAGFARESGSASRFVVSAEDEVIRRLSKMPCIASIKKAGRD